MTRVILVRHGQTFWNLAMKYQGHSDIQLTDLGFWQAEMVARRLAGEQVAAIYASDLSRAYQTAECIAAQFGMQVIAVPALREIQFGEWEGLTYEQIHKKWPDLLAKLFTHSDQIQIPGGETFSAVKERAEAALQQLIKQHQGETIIVVSHGATIRTLLCAALNIHLDNVWSIRQDNTAVNMIEYYPERSIVTLVNDVHHLGEPQY